MTYTEGLRQGAAASRRTSSKNVMELLIRLIEANPKAGTELLFLKWSDAVKDDEDYLDAALRHCFTNLLASVESGRPKPSRSKPSAARTAEQRRQAVEDLKQQARTAVILDFIMPNGKKLRDCTGAYAAQLGGAISRIAAAVKPNQIIGKVLSDEQAQRLASGIA